MKRYFKAAHLLCLDDETLSALPLYILSTWGAKEVKFVFERLPATTRENPEISELQFCDTHWNCDTGDQIDGPPPSRRDCHACRRDKLTSATQQ